MYIDACAILVAVHFAIQYEPQYIDNLYIREYEGEKKVLIDSLLDGRTAYLRAEAEVPRVDIGVVATGELLEGRLIIYIHHTCIPLGL